MYRIAIALIILALGLPGMARADHLDITIKADPALIETGLMKFLLPRFSLKTGIRLHLSLDTPDVTLTRTTGPGARQVLKGPEHVYYVILSPDAGEKTIRFVDWLLDDVGQRTVDQFRNEGAQIFFAAADAAPEVAVVIPEGDILNGERLSFARCGRCHVIGHENRMKGIGSTPSFALLRGFDDWLPRFQGFYTLNPHPSFSQIKDVTPGFDPALPSPINPLELTLEELDDIVAFVAGIKPADLGKPLQTQ